MLEATKRSQEAINQLTLDLSEMLKDNSNVVEKKADFRKLIASYLCEADEDSHYLCTRYSPAPNGDCKYQHETDFGAIICLA